MRRDKTWDSILVPVPILGIVCARAPAHSPRPAPSLGTEGARERRSRSVPPSRPRRRPAARSDERARVSVRVAGGTAASRGHAETAQRGVPSCSVGNRAASVRAAPVSVRPVRTPVDGLCWVMTSVTYATSNLTFQRKGNCVWHQKERGCVRKCNLPRSAFSPC